MLLVLCKQGRKRQLEDGTSSNSLHDLYVAIENNRVDLVRQVLANREKNAVRSDASRAAALHQAVRKNNMEIALFLISRGTDVNRASTDDGKLETPLGTAVRLRNDEMVHLLLECGASPNSADIFSRTPLYHAVYSNQYLLAKALVEHGGNLHAADRQGFTPLHIACRTHGAHDNYLMTSLLLNHGANPNRSSVSGTLPIDSALQKGDYNTVQMLLEAGSVEGLEARNLQAEVDKEKNEERRAWLEKDPCVVVLRKHKQRVVHSLLTLSLKQVRRVLSERERRSGRSILLAAATLPLPSSLKAQLHSFVGPDREFRL